MVNSWGSDVPISKPEPLTPDVTDPGSVPMYGFCFTVHGLRHDLNAADQEAVFIPGYAPHYPAEVVWGDADLDKP